MSYIPENVYGFTGWDDRCRPTYGLKPWPDHLKPRPSRQATEGRVAPLAHSGSQTPDNASALASESPSGVALTKKGEAYAQAGLAEAGGVFFLTIDGRDRTSIATTIERLIDMLDQMESDPDLEDGADDEASLGWTEGGRGTAALDRTMIQDDREAETEHDEDGADDEPTLGAAERHASPYSSWNDRDRTGDQTHWAEGEPWGDEREEVSEDEGAQCDDEGEPDVDAPGLIWGGNEAGAEYRTW